MAAGADEGVLRPRRPCVRVVRQAKRPELPVRLTGEEHIAIGNDVFIGAGSWLQVLGAPAGDSPVIVVGDGTAIAGGCVLSAAHSLRLGRQVLIARNVYISDHVHAFDDTAQAVLKQGITGIGGVEIGDGAWLGAERRRHSGRPGGPRSGGRGELRRP